MAKLPRVGDGVSERGFLPAVSAANTERSFARNRFYSAGVVTALSDPSGSGGRSLPG